MSLTNTPQAKLLFEKMRHTQARQETASDNMARSGVAGAKAKDVEDFKASVKRTTKPASIKTTNTGHMTGSLKQANFRVKTSKQQGEPSLTNNSISAEEQLLALNEASTDFYRLTKVNENVKSRIRTVASIGSGGK